MTSPNRSGPYRDPRGTSDVGKWADAQMRSLHAAVGRARVAGAMLAGWWLGRRWRERRPCRVEPRPGRRDRRLRRGAALAAAILVAVTLDLALIGFRGEPTASSVFGTMRDRVGTEAPWTHEVAVIEHGHNNRVSIRGTFDGHYVDVEESDHVSQSGAAKGALTGVLIGAVLGPPGWAVGFALGGIIGGDVGRPTETEVAPEVLVAELRDAVPRGQSAIALLAAPEHVDAMLAALHEKHESVLRRTLTVAQAAAILASVSEAPQASSGP